MSAALPSVRPKAVSRFPNVPAASSACCLVWPSAAGAVAANASTAAAESSKTTPTLLVDSERSDAASVDALSPPTRPPSDKPVNATASPFLRLPESPSICRFASLSSSLTSTKTVPSFAMRSLLRRWSPIRVVDLGRRREPEGPHNVLHREPTLLTRARAEFDRLQLPGALLEVPVKPGDPPGVGNQGDGLQEHGRIRDAFLCPDRRRVDRQEPDESDQIPKTRAVPAISEDGP